MATIFDFIFDILFPKICLSCHKEGHYICPECLKKVPICKCSNCYICGKRSPSGKICPNCKIKTDSHLTGLLVASDWNNILVRQVIYEFKYRFIKDLSIPLGEILKIFLQNNKLINWQTDKPILIPVPLHKKRFIWRGFNQSELIAEYLSDILKIPLYNNLLVRIRHTEPQAEIKNESKRLKNISNAFEINQKIKKDSGLLRNKIIFLLDDICTTGATLNDCAKTLRQFKPKEIWGLVVARG